MPEPNPPEIKGESTDISGSVVTGETREVGEGIGFCPRVFTVNEGNEPFRARLLMDFDLHTSHVTVEGEFHDYIAKHLTLATKHHDEQIARLTVHLVDTNKTKGGANDISCKIVAHMLNPNGEIVAEGRDHDALAAFNQANHKYTALLKKRIEKHNNHHPEHTYHHHNNPET